MSVPKAIEALQKALPSDQIHLPNSDQFTELNKFYLSRFESDITPAAIVRPKSAEEVSTFIKTIKPFVTDDDGGITLDLRLLKGVEYDEESGIVQIGAGERWGDVYEELGKHGRGITGSRSANGGIGGLALAGGLSFFASREGFICDNVLAALRGGANNFGVVTKFHMRTFEQGPFWGETLIYQQTSFDAQIDALVHHLNEEREEVETHVMVSLFFAAMLNATHGLNQLYYTRAIEDPPVLKPFLRVEEPLKAHCSRGMKTLKEAADEQAKMEPRDKRTAYVNTTVKADAATLHAAAATFRNSLKPLEKCEGLVFSLTLQPYPASLLEKHDTRGGNVTGLSPSDGPLVSVLILMSWENREEDGEILGAARKILEAVDKNAQDRGQAVGYTYLNYAFGFQDPIGSYGEANKTFLKGVSRKVDPEGVFQRGVPGGFKLFV
ncbi:FAD-binding domain-containing protein [Xylariaceae sp. FL0594]|nr:FAD-binding domain-containing protein [Xylariaceae sp. FL0594]